MKVVVIGAGPGGYEAAIYAAKRGCEVILIEKEKLGGTCLNKGCIPTKALLAVTDTLATVKKASVFGIETQAVSNNFGYAFDRKNAVVNGLINGIDYLMKANGVNIINGIGQLKNNNTVIVHKTDGAREEISTDKIILATGSVPSKPSFLNYNKNSVVTSDEILELDEQPKSIIIVGGGVIGCEIGQFLKRMGTEVTIVELMEHLLPFEDDDVTKQLERQFKKEKIKVITKKKVESVNVTESGVQVILQDGVAIEAEKLLISIGRQPFTVDLGLENTDILVSERGLIEVDKKMRTSVEGIYAIGDIVNSPQLAHVASKEALTAVDDICGDGIEINYKAVPRCVYTDPEIACVGMTEEQAKNQSILYTIGSYNFAGLGKAKASDKTTGFVKVIVNQKDEIIGGEIVGAHGTDMLQVLTLAIDLGLTAKQVGQSIFPHPTLCEGIMEALHDVHKRSIHKV
ncbi:dihydrolipoyl dehydrogenase [Acetobacterium sp. KB-1]|jgi:dihydrolipoamide dehydrogenase|uniref:dihydrolipoyl dehydrogenase n=1 Tax=Acetobacterium sp. KB-1 TaxID=2184575 RepID=UPI000DBEB790|nr:dihydrolipoyl dehydrogenase [Acetobacterium sp. KB-1]AWW28150.1 dihydrolipoyl dehydrogenase [Acetobacterium sp. KB-1]